MGEDAIVVEAHVVMDEMEVGVDKMVGDDDKMGRDMDGDTIVTSLHSPICLEHKKADGMWCFC